MRKQRRIPALAYDEVVRLSDKRISPAEIQRELATLGLPAVSLPTIRDIWRERNPPDDSGTWSVLDATGDEASIVLSVLPSVVWFSRGRIRSFTKAEARAIVKVKQAVPELSGRLLWATAREYVIHEGGDLTNLDLFLAFNPIGSPDRREAWREVVMRGWADSEPFFAITNRFNELMDRFQEEEDRVRADWLAEATADSELYRGLR